jgi:hypothetical protein
MNDAELLAIIAQSDRDSSGNDLDGLRSQN